MRNRLGRIFLLAFVVFIVPVFAFATDGYFPHGYGIVAKGMGGVSTAMCTDGLAGAVNPAKLAMAGSELEIGLDLFSPTRSAGRTGNPYGLNGVVESGSTLFAVPEVGYVRALSPKWSVGLTMYGNGGMNTSYEGGQIPANTCGAGAPAANLLCGMGTLGVDLTQMIVAPSISYRFSDRHAVGASVLLGYQRFKMQGVQPFAGMSESAANLTNNGYDSSMGIGVRVGYFGQVTDQVAIGAAFAPRMNMGEFDKYKGLFAEGGDFDIPANYSVGIGITPIPSLTLGADFQRILYSDVNAVGNTSLSFSPLGSAGGPGFGWTDISVLKAGAQYAVSKAVTVRGGYNHSDNPVTSPDVTFNMLAPGVIQDHLTLGASLSVGATGVFHVSYAHAFANTVTGATLAVFPGGGTDAITMSQHSLGFAFTKHLH
jgi:long-chain fatty acid transport protein